jgi:prolyl-tRNA synthetase
MFSDMELIGVPHRIVFSDRGIDAKQFEYKGRRGESAQQIALAELPDFLDKLFNQA